MANSELPVNKVSRIPHVILGMETLVALVG